MKLPKQYLNSEREELIGATVFLTFRNISKWQKVAFSKIPNAQYSNHVKKKHLENQRCVKGGVISLVGVNKIEEQIQEGLVNKKKQIG